MTQTVISLMSFKGGVGKSTLAVDIDPMRHEWAGDRRNIAAHQQSEGRRRRAREGKGRDSQGAPGRNRGAASPRCPARGRDPRGQLGGPFLRGPSKGG